MRTSKANHNSRVSYILPAFPPIALLVAQVWARYWHQAEDFTITRGVRWGALLAGLVMILIALGVLLLVPIYIKRKGDVPFADVKWIAVAFAVTMAGGAAALFYLTLT